MEENNIPFTQYFLVFSKDFPSETFPLLSAKQNHIYYCFWWNMNTYAFRERKGM